MRVVERSVWVPFEAEQMYKLVNDITKYPQFLPGCKEAEIIFSNDDEIHAELMIQKSGIQQAFSTQNRLEKNSRIEMNLLKGPFRHLNGVWDFKPLDKGSEISLTLTFEFNSKLLDLSFGSIFESLIQTMVSAFTERAHVIYAPV